MTVGGTECLTSRGYRYPFCLPRRSARFWSAGREGYAVMTRSPQMTTLRFLSRLKNWISRLRFSISRATSRLRINQVFRVHGCPEFLNQPDVLFPHRPLLRTDLGVACVDHIAHWLLPSSSVSEVFVCGCTSFKTSRSSSPVGDKAVIRASTSILGPL